MNHQHMSPRRIAAAALVLVSVLALVSCGRAVNILTPQPTGTVTWKNTISHLLADRSSGTQPRGCTGCHHDGTNLPDWSDYQTVFNNSGSIRARLFNGGTMREYLSTEEADQVILWIDSGMPEL